MSRRPTERPCYVYFVRCGFYVKIGVASDPASRMGDMQVGNPRELTLDGTIRRMTRAEAMTLEGQLHKAFSQLHVRGEWFRLSREQVGELLISGEDWEYLELVIASVQAQLRRVLGCPGGEAA